MSSPPLAPIYPLVPSALDRVRRRARRAAQEDVCRMVERHAHACPGLADDVATGAADGIADACAQVALQGRRADQ